VGAEPLGKPLPTIGTGIGDFAPKSGNNNFMAYNVEYSQVCISREPFPSIGLAQGQVQIAQTNGKRAHSVFQWTRMGVVGIARLSDTHIEIGGLSKAHKTNKNSATLDPKDQAPLDIDGVALAVSRLSHPSEAACLRTHSRKFS
jgi:hypothetical protein